MTGRRVIRVDPDVIAAGVKQLRRAAEAAGNSDLSRMGGNVQEYDVSHVAMALRGVLRGLSGELRYQGADADLLNLTVVTRVDVLQSVAAEMQGTDAAAADQARSLADHVTDTTGAAPTPSGTQATVPPTQTQRPVSPTPAAGDSKQSDIAGEYAG